MGTTSTCLILPPIPPSRAARRSGHGNGAGGGGNADNAIYDAEEIEELVRKKNDEISRLKMEVDLASGELESVMGVAEARAREVAGLQEEVDKARRAAPPRALKVCWLLPLLVGGVVAGDGKRGGGFWGFFFFFF